MSEPFVSDPDFTFYVGDVRDVLAELPDESVDCVVTSPPYWGLRDYGLPPSVWGGDPDCDHEWISETVRVERTANVRWQHTEGGGGDGTRNRHAKAGVDADDLREFGTIERGKCQKCMARQVRLGLEPTPEEYVANMVEVFREVRRVLAKHGTVWCNMGDSYGPGKQLAGIPWRLAFALQDDGWILRADIVWFKCNPMPESVTDRPTKAHEYVFLLTKSPRYFFDQEAVREASNPNSPFWSTHPNGQNAVNRTDRLNGSNEAAPNTWLRDLQPNTGRNIRSVWEIPTQPYPEAHFATYPEALVERCLKAGCPEGGLVLDPFLGSGTTALVARRLGRRCVGIELSPEYAELAAKRLSQLSLLAQ